MVCGAEDYICLLGNWLLENAEPARDSIKILVGSLEAAFGERSSIRLFLSNYGEKLIAAASLAFGIYKWWVYREAILHKRLNEYITESDQRLSPSSLAVAEALLRPGRSPSLPYPQFARELRRILITRGWSERVSAFSSLTVEGQAHWRLDRNLRALKRRIITARKAMNSLQEQQAQIYLIAGAIAAAKARRSRNDTQSRRFETIALREFQKVLQQPGHQRDVIAKENEAFALLRLGSKPAALAAFEQLEEFAENLADTRTRDLTIARAKRFRAQIFQSAAPGGSAAADALMRGNVAIFGALTLRAAHHPFHDWDAIEQGEMHYVTAYIAHKLGFVLIENQQLLAAQQVYESLRHQLPTRRWFVRQDRRALREAASAGSRRVELALGSSEYADNWLSTR